MSSMTDENKSMGSKVILEVKDISKNFGGLAAISNVSFSVRDNQIKALVGPNGAGKTTLFNLITGTLAPSSGNTFFKGENITSLTMDKIASLGITRTFQHPRLYTNMSVIDNVMLGAYSRSKSGFVSWIFRSSSVVNQDLGLRERAKEILEFVGIPIQLTYAEQLSTGQEKLVEIARAMISESNLILMDEPAAGLNDIETERLAEMIKILRGQGKTIFIVEHNMDLVMGISDEIVVIDHGKKIAEGVPEEVKNNPKVIEAYLGTDIL